MTKGRVLNRVELSRRRLLPMEANLSCILCHEDVETEDHLFR